MKTESKIALFLGVVGVAYVISRRDETEGFDFDTSFIYENVNQLGNALENAVQYASSTVRGMRNNNPGNIRKSGDAWKGLRPAQTDSAFFQFDTMHYGLRALAIIVKNYTRKYGLNTVRGIISRWAPSNENDTWSYVKAVSAFVGVGPDDYVDTYNAETLAKIVRAIIRHENGLGASALINDAQIFDAIGDAA